MTGDLLSRIEAVRQQLVALADVEVSRIKQQEVHGAIAAVVPKAEVFQLLRLLSAAGWTRQQPFTKAINVSPLLHTNAPHTLPSMHTPSAPPACLVGYRKLEVLLLVEHSFVAPAITNSASWSTLLNIDSMRSYTFLLSSTAIQLE